MAEGAAGIAQQMTTYAPEYLLVELGFNDIAWNLGDTPPEQVAAGVISSMQRLVTNARAVNPNVRILLADVPHRAPIESYPQLPGKLTAYNNRLDAGITAVNAQAPGSPAVVRVGFNAAYRYATDTYDGLHPNVRGEYVIAKAFADRLASVYGLGAPMKIPGSLPADLTPGPTGAIGATVNSDWSADLSWPHVFGASGFWIWVRDRTAGETDFHKLPWPVGSDGWKAAALAAGHQIDFRVQTARGDHASAFSPTTTVTAPSLPRVNFTVTPGKYSATIRWTPVPGADDYHLYAGGNCSDPVPSVNENMQLVQWSLGDQTSFTQTYLTGMCMNYYLVAAKNGGEGAKPEFATRVWPIQDNIDHLILKRRFWGGDLKCVIAGAQPPCTTTDRGYLWRGNVGSDTDRGILMMRGFIANNSAMDALIGDHRQWSTGAGQSAKATVVWDTATGDVAIHIHESCLFGDNGWQCKDALPIALVTDAYRTPDLSTDWRNLFSVTKTPGGSLSVDVSAVNAWAPTLRDNTATCIVTLTSIAPPGLPPFIDACDQLTRLGRISDRITATPSGGTFSVWMQGDRYPSWEFYRFPAEGVLGSSHGISKNIGTRTQTVVFDLRGTPTTCTSQAGESDPGGTARPMSCT